MVVWGIGFGDEIVKTRFYRDYFHKPEEGSS